MRFSSALCTYLQRRRLPTVQPLWPLVGLGTLLIALAAGQTLAQSDEMRTVRVQFEPGAESATVEESITGYQSVDYLLRANEGQYANISMASDNGANYFNLIAPGETDVAFFVGSTSGNQYEGLLPATGDYKVRVYLMRNAARRNETANYRLEMIIGAGQAVPANGEAAATIPAAPEEGGPRYWQVTVEGNLRLRATPSTSGEVVASLATGAILNNLGCESAGGRAWCYVQPLQGGSVGYVAAEYIAPATGPDGAVAYGPNESATRAGQGEFDATGQVACAQQAEQPLVQCDFGVARAGSGDATVVITHPDGSQQILFFSFGEFISASTSEAGSGFDSEATKENDLIRVRVDDARYELFDAIIFGG